VEAAILSLIGVVLGSVLTHVLGGKRERRAERRAWSRAQLADVGGAVGALVDLSKVEPFGIGMFGSDEQAREDFDRYRSEFEECRRAIRPLLLHPDHAVRDATSETLQCIWPALGHAHGLRFLEGATTAAEVRETWGALAAAASNLATVVRRAGEAS
jgi:hypothetical protein